MRRVGGLELTGGLDVDVDGPAAIGDDTSICHLHMRIGTVGVECIISCGLRDMYTGTTLELGLPSCLDINADSCTGDKTGSVTRIYLFERKIGMSRNEHMIHEGKFLTMNFPALSYPTDGMGDSRASGSCSSLI